MTLPLSSRPTSTPNELQRAASDPAASVWVNASAGSGKTSVLTARVMRLLLDGVAPQKILCLTYTRAGAAEMANRITARLSKWAACDDDTLRRDIDELQNAAPRPAQVTEARRLFARVLACPGGLRIRTIHSFCQEILSRFPIEAGIPPHFALIEDQDLAALKDEVLDDLLREAADAPESALGQALSILIATQGEKGFSDMLKEATQAWRRLKTTPDEARRLIAKTRAFLNLAPDDTPASLRARAMREIPEADLRRLAKALAEGSSSHVARSEKLCAILARIPLRQGFGGQAAGEGGDPIALAIGEGEGMVAGKSVSLTSSTTTIPSPASLRSAPSPAMRARESMFDDYVQIFLTKEFEQRKAFADKKTLAKHPEILPVSESEAVRLRSVLERIEAAEIAETTESVLFFGLAFAKRLAARKAARAALDYDDLILFTENLLRQSGISPWILYKLDNGLDHILLDEAQDTSRAQWNIVQALTEEFFAGLGARADASRTLFVVGDEKQSIFSFQNADPKAFLLLRTFFERRLKDAGKKLDILPMRTSFRSAPAILDAVDAVFAPPAARQGVSPDPIAHKSFPNPDGSPKLGRVEIWPLETKPLKTPSGDEGWALPLTCEEDSDPQAELAEKIALTIKNWLSARETLPGENRPLSPSDIMILLRRRGQFASLMVRALKAHKIPVTGVDRMRLVNQLPVMDLLAAMRFVLLPEDDLNLATLLRGPLLGLDEESLMALAMNRTGSLWEAVQASPGLAPVCAYLREKWNEADFATPFAFLSNLLLAPCPANKDSGRKALWARLGDEALDPIDELLNKAQDFSQNHPPSLQNFLHWLTQSDVEIKRELDRSEGQVRIMTVHASKGLEAPIVFLPDTTAVPQAKNIPKFQWSDDGAPLFMKTKPTFGNARALWDDAYARQLEEYRRLLYVALTRASRRLYICGWKNDAKDDAAEASWYALAASALREKHQENLAKDAFGVVPDIVFADPSPPPLKAAPVTPSALPHKPLPSWIRTDAPEETTPQASAPGYGASLSAATPDAAFTRGRIIHRLLQSLPDVAPDKRAEAASRFLKHPHHGLDEAVRAEIEKEVLALLRDEKFEALFAPGSLAEAPLTGTLDGAVAFRQIDRLCLKGDEVWIVDYKTNRPPPDKAENVPEAYRKQLAEYRALLSGIYPGKAVRTFLLWTYAPRLMEV